MNKIILITGATDGIGLATAKLMASNGHNLIIHGRNNKKVKDIKEQLQILNPEVKIDGFVADFSRLADVKVMSETIRSKYSNIDVLINNAGVFTASDTITEDGLELRFEVNTIAPYLLTKLLLPILSSTSRVINLSSAAQASVNITALLKGNIMDDNSAYAQSKLAITMWSMELGREFINDRNSPSIIAVNPKSFLGSKMVKEAYGSDGYDLRIGADILNRASLSDEFSNASGKYFDNDIESFSAPYADALDKTKCLEVINSIEEIIGKLGY